jgi:hypothetical protein
MAGPPVELSPVIAASTHWLAAAYPADGDAVAATLVELQARQAVTVAAWLRYPTRMDAELVAIAGPGGSAVLDWRVGAEPGDCSAEGEGWRTWVDEVVVSWAACLLADPELAGCAVAALIATTPAAAATDRPSPRPARPDGMPSAFRRLTAPDSRDLAAAMLLRHPDLLAPVADPHRAALLALLHVENSDQIAA